MVASPSKPAPCSSNGATSGSAVHVDPGEGLKNLSAQRFLMLGLWPLNGALVEKGGCCVVVKRAAQWPPAGGAVAVPAIAA